MKNLKLHIMLLATLISFNEGSYSQDKKSPGPEAINPVITEIHDKDASSMQRDPLLEKNMREQRLAGNKTAVERLQKEMAEKYDLNKHAGEVKIVRPIKADYFNHENDNQNFTSITLIDSLDADMGHNTVSEQLGLNKGRIWNVTVDFNVSRIRLFYSDDSGINWFHFADYVWAFPQFNVLASDIDVEIAVNTYTNDKMLYALFSCSNPFTNNTFVGIIRVNVGNNPGYSSQTLFDYGSPLYGFFQPRITSDNAAYITMPYIHIGCYQYKNDSYGANQSLRYAIIMSSFDVNAPIYYPNARIITYSSVQDLLSFDMCVFTNQISDYVFFVSGNFTFADKNLTIIQSTFHNALAGGSALSASLGNYANKLSVPKVSSDGSNIMIVCTYRYSATDDDIQYFKSSSGIYGFNTSGFVDNSAMNEYRPAITSELNGNGRFFCCYGKNNGYGFNSIYYASSQQNQWYGYIKMISTNDLSNFNPFGFFPVMTLNNDCLITWRNAINGSQNKIYSATGCSGNIVMTKKLRLKVFIEGFYRKTTDQMFLIDTIKVLLRNPASPYAIIDSARSVIGKNGTGSFNFSNAVNNQNYYIVVRHRNSIETWSKAGGAAFVNDTLSYNFTLNNSQAFGSNQKLIDESPRYFGIYSGDVNQDGIVDSRDLSLIDNDVINFVYEYTSTDLTGDNITDSQDLSIADNNVFNYVSRIRP